MALSSDAPSDSRFKHIQHLIEDTYQAMLSVPLVGGGNVIGIVNVHRLKPHEYTPDKRPGWRGANSNRAKSWSGPRASSSAAKKSARKKPTSACEIKAAASSAP